MKILLTGSAGFIGFHTTKHLLERGDTVIGFDNFNQYYDPKLKDARNAILEEYDNFTLIRGDLKDVSALEDAFNQLGSGDDTRVCHLAAQAGVRHSVENPEEFLADNIGGFGNVIELVKTREVGGLIYASSSSVYGNSKEFPSKETQNTDNQVSLYGMTKKSNELHASVYNNLFGIHCTGLRFFTVYGPYGRPDMALFLFTDAILNDRSINVFGEGKQQRDFTYVDDIVSGVVASLDKNYENEVFNLGCGRQEELMDFIATVEKACGKEAKKNMMPMQLGDVPRTSADISKAKEMLGYSPKTPISDGVPKFVEWYKGYVA
ncbi:MAG: NAD-dependent epimerase/dehydratase family protein [Candidatus Peregrinibacteria bacterium]|nr:NAD-dependent epimerase/dehydratase family protein [Candidatus Peregrinibacteria bacterium]MCB9808013.1 NAD-dependent epimerase/dehydratase family protein [Candidatus Peribacteria bacterium]